MHKISGFDDPVATDYQLKLVLRGIKRDLGTAQSPVAAISPHQLLKIKAVLNLNDLSDLVFWCACLIAFYGLLRPGSVTVKGSTFDKDTDVRRIDLLPHEWGFLLCLSKTKTIQFREKAVEVVLPMTGNALCPASALHALLRRTGPIDTLGPLLIQEDGSPLSYKAFCAKLQLSLKLAGEENSQIRAHSFRRGGASWLAKLGFSIETIKSIGYWSSDAVLRYIESNFSTKLNVAKQFGSSLC
ncbi:uncharacterized protein LOC117317432 [Pecten maximus]|uniref:uncharacterized protein LOC117317432 n=1 Tax=Pecten maximus TaxID=6579 RepID=UPI0014582A5A|nr:uncharacterized protein LOC117317432 [Pecten maximus]